MITVRPTKSTPDCLLVTSDQTDRTAARREVAAWAVRNHVELPRRPRRLSLVDGAEVVSEWFVIDRPMLIDPDPVRVRPFGPFRLVESQSAA